MVLARTRALDGSLAKVEPKQNFGIFDPFFLPVADAPLTIPQTPVARTAGRMVKLANPGFESSLSGWKLSVDLEKNTSSGNNIVKPYRGKSMFGWMRIPQGEKDHERYRKDYINQKVKVKQGTWYELSVWAFTHEPDWPKEKWMTETWTYPFFQSRCRNRISLIVDSSGGEDFTGPNSTQWFSTHGGWMLLEKKFQAKSSNVTLGAAFYHRGERDWDVAFIDDFQLVEIEKPS